MSEKKDTESIEYFISKITYPDVGSIFNHQPKTIDTIKSDCLIVLDTNVLLVPYTVGSKGLEEIRKTFNKLTMESRLFIPGQVVREFAKNRPNKLTEIYQQLSDYKSKISKINTPKYPLFELLEEYKNALDIQTQANELINKYQKEISKVLEYIKELNWDDHVSSMYRELFKDKLIVELDEEDKVYTDEFQIRSRNNIPPGFKDKSKTDGGIGDFLIWKTILELGSMNKKDLIFVTGDEKSDWYHQSMNTALFPRYELVDEYSRKSDGATFRMLNFSALLSLFGVAEEVVEEVHTIEHEKKTINSTKEITNEIRNVVLNQHGIPITARREADVNITFKAIDKDTAKLFGIMIKNTFKDEFFAEKVHINISLNSLNPHSVRIYFTPTEIPSVFLVYDRILELSNNLANGDITEIDFSHNQINVF